MKMKRNHSCISAATLLTLLALASILLAPVAALSHNLLPDAAVSMTAGDCGGCHDDSQDTGKDDCCTTACACACHAPLTIKAVTLPVPVALTSCFASFNPHLPPQVYLPIFVPPQNRS